MGQSWAKGLELGWARRWEKALGVSAWCHTLTWGARSWVLRWELSPSGVD
jgi:hypothetical protein